jgi:hypothetical protein
MAIWKQGRLPSKSANCKILEELQERVYRLNNKGKLWGSCVDSRLEKTVSEMSC